MMRNSKRENKAKNDKNFERVLQSLKKSQNITKIHEKNQCLNIYIDNTVTKLFPLHHAKANPCRHGLRKFWIGLRFDVKCLWRGELWLWFQRISHCNQKSEFFPTSGCWSKKYPKLPRQISRSLKQSKRSGWNSRNLQMNIFDRTIGILKRTWGMRNFRQLERHELVKLLCHLLNQVKHDWSRNHC